MMGEHKTKLMEGDKAFREAESSPEVNEAAESGKSGFGGTAPGK